MVEVEVPVGDGVGDAETGQPRWRSRVGEVADESEPRS
jgi:hypothetical protein